MQQQAREPSLAPPSGDRCQRGIGRALRRRRRLTLVAQVVLGITALQLTRMAPDRPLDFGSSAGAWQLRITHRSHCHNIRLLQPLCVNYFALEPAGSLDADKRKARTSTRGYLCFVRTCSFLLTCRRVLSGRTQGLAQLVIALPAKDLLSALAPKSRFISIAF